MEMALTGKPISAFIGEEEPWVGTAGEPLLACMAIPAHHFESAGLVLGEL